MPLSWNEIRQRAIAFSREWSEESRERAESQSFWNEFFEVFGVRRRTVASFEEPVRNLSGDYEFIDLLWPGVLITEHKSRGRNLGKAESQAMGYIRNLAREDRRSEIPQFIIVSDFARLALHDLENDASLDFDLSELHEHIHAFAFIAGYRTEIVDPEDPANIEAAELLAQLYDTLRAGGYPDHDVERFMVRLLFCMFAEDTGLFDQPNAFQLYLENTTQSDGSDLGMHLARYFDVLNTPLDQRQANLDEQLASLPYVNGDLFAQHLPFADFNRDMRNQLLACSRFRWTKISPAVFGSLFQSIMEAPERRQIGAHYTSERDIMKLIKSLFLDELHEEFERAKNTSKPALRRFHRKIGDLKFLDPACGCGNFLVITYRELRKLELKILKALHTQREIQTRLDFNLREELWINVGQMHGIEIEEWPVRIAEVAMWLMDHQMNLEVSETFGQFVDRLPLTETPHIVCANALRMEWNDVLPAEECDYVLGNPPFVGGKHLTNDQRNDIKKIWGDLKNRGLLDYVTCWYAVASVYLKKQHGRAALVSTNSITQGEQVGVLWPEMFQRGMVIDFGHRTFPWASEARGGAHVHVVIIGFGYEEPERFKTIFNYDGKRDSLGSVTVPNISPYLTDGSNIAVTNRNQPICDVPEIGIGNKPIDGGYYLFEADEKDEFLKVEPEAEKYFRRWYGAREFLQGNKRWCLWLSDLSPEKLHQMPHAMERVNCVTQYRRGEIGPKSKPNKPKKKVSPGTIKLAEIPRRFHVENIPIGKALIFPRHASERRDYIPLGFMENGPLVGDACLLMSDATTYYFGILHSAMHMAWVRQVCGRIKSDYRYSARLVYNNFLWPESPTEEQKERVETAAKAVLDTRDNYPDATLADLYDPLSMPANLRRAHNTLDRAVDRAYRRQPFPDERRRFEYLFEMYERLIAPLTGGRSKKKRSRRKKKR